MSKSLFNISNSNTNNNNQNNQNNNLKIPINTKNHNFNNFKSSVTPVDLQESQKEQSQDESNNMKFKKSHQNSDVLEQELSFLKDKIASLEVKLTHKEEHCSEFVDQKLVEIEAKDADSKYKEYNYLSQQNYQNYQNNANNSYINDNDKHVSFEEQRSDSQVLNKKTAKLTNYRKSKDTHNDSSSSALQTQNSILHESSNDNINI
mmetsp:Transcript_36714/g.79952  ORF Transcript_36714/g.79952 Transcript_36714/m.79952 type:complete len:205 (-) Transcript_36714:1044-1658(-)